MSNYDQRNHEFSKAMTDAQSAYIEAERQVVDLEADNEKLRGLVRYMHRCYVSGHDWGSWGAPEKQHVEDIMRELGIEVY